MQRPFTDSGVFGPPNQSGPRPGDPTNPIQTSRANGDGNGNGFGIPITTIFAHYQDGRGMHPYDNRKPACDNGAVTSRVWGRAK